MKYTILIVLLLAGYLAASGSSLFFEGCKEYDHKQYDKAIAKYNELLYAGVESGEIYYNLGNAYYKNGDIVNALVNYERAARLIPNDEDLEANLNIARQKIVDRTEPVPVLPVVEYFNRLGQNYNIYTIKPALLTVLFLTVLIATLLFWIQNSRLRVVFYTLSGAGLCCLLLLSFFAYRITSERARNFGIISADKIAVLASPDDNLNNTELFSLHKGAKVEIHRTSDQWLEISLGKDKKGWVTKENLVVI